MSNNDFQYTKNCEICGNEFRSNTKRAKYCSDECRYTASRKRTYKCVCAVCGEQFEGTSATNKYCSEKCRGESHTHICRFCGNEYKSSHQEKLFCSDECRKKQLTKKCECCGNEFLTKNTDNKYCSYECKSISTGKYERICDTCGKTFRSDYFSAKYCSENCRPIMKKLCVCCGKVFETKSYNKFYCNGDCHLNNNTYIYKLTTKNDEVFLIASKKELEEHFYNYSKFDNSHRKKIQRKLNKIYRVNTEGDIDLAMKKLYLIRKYKPSMNYHTEEPHKEIPELESNSWELIFKRE